MTIGRTRTPQQHQEVEQMLRQLYTSSRIVSDKMRRSPGGDEFTFAGSTMDVDQLREDLDRIFNDELLSSIVYDESDIR